MSAHALDLLCCLICFFHFFSMFLLCEAEGWFLQAGSLFSRS